MDDDRAALAVQLCLSGLSPAMAGPATESIRGTIDEVFKVLNDQELKKPARHEPRRQRLEDVVGRDSIIRKWRGGHWAPNGTKCPRKINRNSSSSFERRSPIHMQIALRTTPAKASNTSTSGRKKNMPRCGPRSSPEKLKSPWITASAQGQRLACVRRCDRWRQFGE